MPRKTESKKDDSSPFRFAAPVDYKTTLEMNQKFMKAMQAYNEELIKFGTSRLKEDMAMPQQLSACKNPQEIIDVYTGFFQTAVKQYAEEAASLGNLYHIFSAQADEDKEKPLQETDKSKSNPE